MSADPNLPLVVKAKGSKYTLIPKTSTHDEVLQMWHDVSTFITRRLVQQKAVNITGLGMFSVLKRKLDIGNNGKLCVQRPIFVLSEKFAQTHGIKYTKYQSLGEVPVIQLNYAAIATDLGIERSVVEICMKELIGAFARIINTQRKGELTFKDVGTLVVKDSKAKMKFSKDFLKLVDSSSLISLEPLSLGRPRTSDSFISQSSVLSTPAFSKSTNRVLPKIETTEIWERPPSVVSNHGMGLVLSPVEPMYENKAEDDEKWKKTTTGEHAQNVGEHLEEKREMRERDMHRPMPVPPCTSIMDNAPSDNKRHKTDLKPSSLKNASKEGKIGSECGEEKSVQFPEGSEEGAKGEHCGSQCSHRSGQELCYLCHQRQKRNVSISFAEEKNRCEMEQDRVMQQYQELKDQEFYDQESAFLERERAISKKVAQFNLSTSEQAKQAVPSEYHHSYMLNRRVKSPSRFLTQEQYNKSLGEQVTVKTKCLKRLKDANDRLEQNEQSYLARELAEAREQFLESKANASKQYQSALSTQVKNKPFRLPKAEPDSDGPIFGRMDMTTEKDIEMRKRAKEVLNHQLNTIQDKKDKSARVNEQNKKYETSVLKKAKKELQQDNYKRFQVTNGVRKELEQSWTSQHREKMREEQLEQKHQLTAGLLLLDQCDKYSRCRQCERCCDNIGTSNVWRESRYISGFRLMV